jgi:hypothetical protein
VSPKLDLSNLSGPRFLALFAACFAIAALPILIVATLPLVDYPNHLARMHIIAAYAAAPALRGFYALSWRPVPNLAMDLIIPGLARIMSLEWAGKIFFLLTFLMTAGGTAAIHRLLFRRWSSWPLLAFLLLYNRSLLWGFGNFLFGVGLALVAFAFWIGLRDRPATLRLAVAIVLAPAVFFAHFFAFGAYGLLILGYEVARLRKQPRPAGASGLRDLAVAVAQFILPIAIFLATRQAGDADGISYSRFFRKADLLFNIVDNYVPWFDVLTLLLLVGLFALGAVRRRIALSPLMALPLLALCLAQIAMPNRIFGAAGVDHRMPLILALVLIGATEGAIADLRRQNAIAALLALLFVVRMSIVTVTWVEQDRILAPMVEALGHLPPGSRLAVAYPPASVHVQRSDPPLLHLAALAVVHADAFVPTLFAEPGQQPLTLRAPYAALAAEASPDDFWNFLVEGRADDSGRITDALGHYDFVLVVAPGHIDRPGLERRAAIAGAQLFAIKAAAN